MPRFAHLLLAFITLPLGAQQLTLLPQPTTLHQSQGSLTITPTFTTSLPANASPRLQQATLRALQRLEDRTGLQLNKSFITANPTLTIEVASDGAPVQTIDEDESYTLTTSPTSIRLEAPTTVGAIHGLETLLQLLQPQANTYTIPAVTIHDSPRFPWRGLMIDCGRHFEPLDVLKRNLDAMAAVKLNVFHWHLTEDQGFRIQSLVYPNLTAKGSDGLFYTQQDARDLVAYARARGIRIVPEFEMPGHSTAWLVAYPELASGTNPTGIRREFGVSDYVLDPTREETYQFIQKFLAEMATIFPDRYIHIGGDEAPAPDWKTNPRILAFMRAHALADNDALQAYFNQRILKILTALDRRMVGWDEIFNPALPKDVVVQSWRGEASLAKGATQGYQGILSAPYYLDAMKPSGVHYLADPVPADTKLTPEQQKLILGGEVCMWAEHLDRRTIDSRIWPRTAAIAERFWSPQSVRDVDDMYRRLQPISLELETLGLRHLTSEPAHLRELSHSEDIAALQSFAQAFEPVPFGERYKQQKTTQLTPLTSFVDAVTPDPPIRHHLEIATLVLLATPTSPAPHNKTSPSTQNKMSTAAQDKTLSSFGEAGGPASPLPTIPEVRQTLLTFFDTTAASVPHVQALMPASPQLQTMSERATQLQALTAIGKQALRLLETGEPAPPNWKQQSLAQIEAAKKPSALVRFTFLQPLADLVNATH